jgi:hypothetical protein
MVDRVVAGGWPGKWVSQEKEMSTMTSSVRSPVVWTGIGLSGLLLAAAASLWAYYGTAVFFEVIRSGLAACF